MNFSKYENCLPYPESLLSHELLRNMLNKSMDRPYLQTLNPTQEAEMNVYLLAKADYDTVTANLEHQFMTDALAEVGLTGHPKADKALSLAYRRGHSSGMSEVFNELQILAELLLD